MSRPVARTQANFTFEVEAPRRRVFPLFGAWGERAWAAGWAPRFLYPSPPRDEPHAVFTIRWGRADAVWVNTAYDPRSGRIQYVYVLPGVQAVTIDLALSTPSRGRTRVEVTYRRTALRTAANARVRAMGARDRRAGPGWRRDVARALSRVAG